ncbi:MAG: class flavin-dependent oxidoreductase, partial [Acidimicrobiales bacterium]|nr:class flavin-dependent oxidoreductase [Acidimicrobiales bacterium]
RAKLTAAVPAGRSLVGSSARLVDLVGEYAAAGVDEFALPDFTVGDSTPQRREAIERFRDVVGAHFM